jgi:uncharacterized protein YjiS (DUF1127 family)
MSHYIDGDAVAAFVGRRTFSCRLFFKAVTETAHVWRKRQRQRRELLDYLAADHRAARDMGIDRSNAREWAERPFWRA